jgi:membrane protease YdiL (CAAX protease family)
MTHLRSVVVPLRVLLVVVFSALVLAQVRGVPEVLPDLADPTLEREVMRAAMLVVAVLALGCVQVVLVCTWKLLTLVTDDRIFSDGAMPWVNGIVRAVVAGWVMLLATFVCSYYFIVDEVSDDPVLPALLLLSLLVGAVIGLLVVVLRALLRQATALRTDMEAVI